MLQALFFLVASYTLTLLMKKLFITYNTKWERLENEVNYSVVCHEFIMNVYCNYSNFAYA